jgi:hypothetical protein
MAAAEALVIEQPGRISLFWTSNARSPAWKSQKNAVRRLVLLPPMTGTRSGFENQAIDYLLKPVTRSAFRKQFNG